MARGAEEALVKIEAVLPKEERARITSTQIHAPTARISMDERRIIDAVERAVDQEMSSISAIVIWNRVKASVIFARSAFGSGARSGRLSAGANCAMLSVHSARTGSWKQAMQAASSGPNAARHWPISTASWN